MLVLSDGWQGTREYILQGSYGHRDWGFYSLISYSFPGGLGLRAMEL